MERWLLLSLAVWRVSALLTVEAGPFGLLAHGRDWVGVYYDDYSQCQGRNVLAAMLCCLRCTSIWVGLIVALVFYPQDWVVQTLALSAAAIVIERVVHG